MKAIRVLAGFLISGGLQAQEVHVDDLQAPSAPAFTILGVQPAEIARPKSYKALETSLLSSFTSGNSWQIPTTYALEVTPFWLKSQDVTVRELMNPGLAAFKQTASVSLATARRADLTDPNRTVQQVGFGFRGTLFPGRLTDRFNTDLSALTSRMAVIGDVKFIIRQGRGQKFTDEASLRKYLDTEFGQLFEQKAANKQYVKDVDQLRTEIVERVLFGRHPINNAQCHLALAEMNELLNTYDTKFKLQELAKRVERHYFYRTGFRMDLAGAASLDFPTNRFDYSLVSKKGIWLTPSYSWVSGDVNVELLGVARFINNRIPTFETNNWDVGGRAALTRRSLSVSTEFIRRFQQVIESKQPQPDGSLQTISSNLRDYRLAFNVEWRLSERFVLAYSLGRNFTLNTEFNGNLISILGLNFGLVGPSVKIAQ